MSDSLSRESRQFNLKVVSILHKGGSVGRNDVDSQILSQFCSRNALINQFPESAFQHFTKNMSIQTLIEDDILFYQGLTIGSMHATEEEEEFSSLLFFLLCEFFNLL